MLRPPLILALALLGAGGAPGLAAGDTYFVPPGVEEHVLSLIQSPAIRTCGWRAEGIQAGPQTVRYTFHRSATDERATVVLAHPSTCLAVVKGPGSSFCVSLVEQGASAEAECGPALLTAEITGAIRESEAGFRWIRPRPRPPAPPPPGTSKWEPAAEDPPDATGEFSLYLLALAAFVAVRLRGWRLLREGLLHLRPGERLGLLLIPLAATGLALGVYGSGDLTLWVGEQAFSAGGLLRLVGDPASLEGLHRALLMQNAPPAGRLLLALLLGALCLLQAFALAWRAGCSPRLSLVLITFLGASPLFGRFATAEPSFLLALTLGLATLHAAAAWMAGPTSERLWALGTAYLAGAWLVVGPGSLLGLPLLLLLHPLGEQPGKGGARRLTLAALLGLTLGLGLLTALGSLLPEEIAAAEHRTVPGLLLHYHLAHPLLATLALLGLGTLPGLRGSRLLLAILGLISALTFGLGGALGGWSALPVFTFVALPLLLLSGAGLARAARWLPEAGPSRHLITAAALLLLLHHTLLFHGTFGRLLFS